VAKRLTRHLVWQRNDAPPDMGHRTYESALVAPRPVDTCLQSSETLYLDVYKAPRERAAYLLKIAAEVEHSLMVQYLFAAWSLGPTHRFKPNQTELALSWRETILEIAREEMGHLATVENLLILIGGALSFARQDYPAPADLYPFDFELAPLTKASLGKYVLAEMPSDAILEKLGLRDEIEGIRTFVGAGESLKIHRVGVLHDRITGLFTAPAGFQEGPAVDSFIAAADIQPDSLPYMVRPGEWGLGYNDLLIFAPTNRKDAIDAIGKISDQGEGTGLSDFDQSHFGKFLKIYRQFPEEEWTPARRLAKNPTLDPSNAKGSEITNEDACKWARLFNLRYRMLLMYLVHSFAIDAPARPSSRNSRGLLISWTFGEMYNLRSIADILMDLPLGTGSNELAGPSFEMPSSLDLALREPDRWRLHRDLITDSQHYIAELLACSAGIGHEKYLHGLRSANSRAFELSVALV